MPIAWDKTRKRWKYQLRRVVGAGRRVRINRSLPRGWSRAQAQAYDDLHTPRLLALAAGLGERDSPQIAVAVDLYLAERVPALKSAKSVREDLAEMFPYFTGRPFDQLPDVSREYARDAFARVDEKGEPDPLAPATVRKRIALVRAACRYAWKAHAMGDRDPGERVFVPQVRNERQTYLDRADVLRAARRMGPGDPRAAVLVAFYSGMRLAEILRAEHVETADGAAVFVLEDTKNGEPRIVPVHSRVAVYARRRFPLQQKRAWIQRQFLNATRALELVDIHFHDLRHSTASAMVNEGVDLYTVGAVLGHKSAQSTKRYAHLATATLSKALELIGRKRTA